MKDTLAALLSSRKALVGGIATLAAFVLIGLGRLDAKEGLDFVKWVLLAWMGSQAVEDGAKHIGSAVVTARSLPPPPGGS